MLPTPNPIINATSDDHVCPSQMAKASHEQLLHEFRGKVLPSNHPLTLAIRQVVTRILEASNLGSLKAEPAFIQQPGASIEDFWHADVQAREEPVPGSGGREWRLMVVNDPKVVNAMASFGQRLAAYISRKTSFKLNYVRQGILSSSPVLFLSQKMSMASPPFLDMVYLLIRYICVRC